MDPERWRQITELFDQASDLTETARAELFARVPPELRVEVESLLAHAADVTLDKVHDAIAAAAQEVLIAPPDQAPALVGGARLGRYVVLDRLGAGGMGVVYAAWDPELDRKVAVKLLHSAEGPDSQGESPLLREAKAMARLAHPNVLAIHDVGTLDGQVFVTTEFVAGDTLRRWLKTPRAWQEILGVLIAAGRGLAAAHAAGIIHRDIKPDNIMIDAEGRVRVMDFGLAGGTAAAQTTIAGTPAYMAPEQWQGAALDARTDVFSFCVTAWESFYGERPFEGGTMTLTAQAIAHGRIKSPRPRSRLPRRLLQILQRGLQSAPEGRYPDMGALLADLQRDPWAQWLRALRVALAGTALVALASLLFLLTRPGRVSVRVTSEGVALTEALVRVGPYDLTMAEGQARGEVPAGTYRLTVQVPNYLPRETVVEVERAREVHLDLEVQHEQGRLDLTASPAGSTIYVDGVDHGGRLRGLALDTGTHRLRVRHPGHYDVERSVTVSAGQTHSEYVTLPPGEVWSQRDFGIQDTDRIVGDVDQDGQVELLHRSFVTIALVSPWDRRQLWRSPTESAQMLGFQTGDLDGDALVDLVIIAEHAEGRTEVSAWSGARLADPHPRPLWTRNGRAPKIPRTIGRTDLLVDIDSDGADDLITADLDPRGITACSGRSGAVLWRTHLAEDIQDFIRDRDRLFVATLLGRHALDLRSGAVLWSKSAPLPKDGQLNIARGTGAVGLLVGTYRSNTGILDLEAHDARDGTLRWTWSGPSSRQTFIVPDEGAASSRALITSSELLALDTQTGALRWQRVHSGSTWVLGSEADASRELAALSTEKGLAVHHLVDGTHLFDLALDGPVVTSPVRFDWDADGEHELAVADQSGTITMVDEGGTLEGSLYLPDTSPTRLIPLGDIDRDGFDDLSVMGSGGPSLVLGPKVLWSRVAQDALRAAPLIADLNADGRLEIIVFGIFDGARGLHCFDAATGETCWPADPIPGADIIRAPALVPRAEGGLDLLSRGGPALFLHDGRTGVLRSRRTFASLGYASPLLTDLEGLRVALLAPWDGTSLLVLDPAELAIRREIPLPAGSWNPPVQVREGAATLLVFHLLNGELRVIDLASGTPRWTRPCGQTSYIPPTIADLEGDGSLELIASEVGDPGDLVCLRLSDGTELWRRPGLAGRNSPIVAHDLEGDGSRELLHTSKERGIFALERDGTTRWQFSPRPALERQPLSDGGGLLTDLEGDGSPEFVTALRDGVVYVLDARTGAFRWQFRAGARGEVRTGEERIEAPPVAADVDGDGRKELVVVGHDRVLRVLRTPSRASALRAR